MPEAGMNGHISKPVSLDKFKEILSYGIHWEEKNKRKKAAAGINVRGISRISHIFGQK